MSTRKPNSDLEKNQLAKGLTPRSSKVRSQRSKSIVSSESDHQELDNLIAHHEPAKEELKVSKLKVESEVPSVTTADAQKLEEATLSLSDANLQPGLPPAALTTNQASTQTLDWLMHFQRYSQLLMAVVEPGTFKLQYANNYFCSLMGVSETYSDLGAPEIRLLDLLPDWKGTAVESLYRQHVLYLVLRDIYKINIPSLRLLAQPVLVSLKSPLYSEPRLIEFAFRSEQLTIARLDSQVDELADLNLEQLLVENRSARLLDSAQLEAWRQRLRLENYQLSGQLLLEGSDVTERETIRDIIGL